MSLAKLSVWRPLPEIKYVVGVTPAWGWAWMSMPSVPGSTRIGPNSSSMTHGDTRSVWLPAKDRMTGVFWTMVLRAVSTLAILRSPSSAHIPDEARKMRGNTKEAPAMADPCRNSRRSMRRSYVECAVRPPSMAESSSNAL